MSKTNMSQHTLFSFFGCCALLLSVTGCGSNNIENIGDNTDTAKTPAQIIDMSEWNITLPADANSDGKPDVIAVKDIQAYFHPHFFFVNEQDQVVFTSPNVAAVTENTKNTRSELRHMSRGFDDKIDVRHPKNNFALSAHPKANEFASIGGNMQATLQVNHVALNTIYPHKRGNYSVVIGQIHAGKKAIIENGFGYGNEPLKIFYKKFPDHSSGSVFWTYERNLPKEDKNRTDIVYPVWGNVWTNANDPGEQGITLAQSFNYEVNVHNNVMQLQFSAEGRDTVTYKINLSDNINAYGEVDSQDLPLGYAGDTHYFKAGAYNQCNGNPTDPTQGSGCAGTGDWEIDKRNGDYAEVAFTSLVLGPAKPITD